MEISNKGAEEEFWLLRGGGRIRESEGEGGEPRMKQVPTIT